MLISFIKSKISPSLSFIGFQRRGLVFERNRSGVSQIIEFQRDPYSLSGELSFTINLGVFHSEVWSKMWGVNAPSKLKGEHCFPLIRVGDLLDSNQGGHFDKWWKISDTDAYGNAAREISQILTGACVNALNSLENYDNILSYMGSLKRNILPYEKLYLAIVLDIVGNSEKSELLLQEVSHLSADWSRAVGSVRERLQSN